MRSEAHSASAPGEPSLTDRPVSHWGTLAGELAVCIAYFLFCVLAQYVSGTWKAGYLVTLDEPSHFVGSVMIRDWMASGHLLSPLAFARNYYDHYPFLAIGYWPPLFNIVAGSWMLVAGVGRVQALLIPAACAAATGWLVFHLVRQRAGILAGVCAGLLYLEIPDVREGFYVVMVDHMTTFLTIAAAACLLRYLKHPVLSNGVLCGVVYSLAILSKYSAAYLVVLPFVTVVVLRRWELLRKVSLLIQPVLVAVLAGPWIFFTRKMAFIGLPADRPPVPIYQRALIFLSETFSVFPPWWLVLIVLGLVVLACVPRAWKEDVVVLVLLFAMHSAFLIASPVDPEHRYLLISACALLVLALFGWSSVLMRLPRRRETGRVAVVMLVVLTAGVMIFEFSHVERKPDDSLRPVIESIIKGDGRQELRVVVPPMLEGPFIAEFVERSCCRPHDYLLRPSKVLGHGNWFMEHVVSYFQSPEDMMRYFQLHPVDLIVWQMHPRIAPYSYAVIMRQMLDRYPDQWRMLQAEGDESTPLWQVYRYVGGKKP